MDFSEEQKKAIKSLERAFKKAKNAGLYMLGVDNDLIISNKSSYKYNPETELSEMINSGIRLETYGIYEDSCAS